MAHHSAIFRANLPRGCEREKTRDGGRGARGEKRHQVEQ